MCPFYHNVYKKSIFINICLQLEVRNKKGRQKPSFFIWWTNRDFALEFFKASSAYNHLCLEKSFGHRLKPSTGSFFNGWGSTLAFHPHMLQNEKRRDELVFFHFGGYGGIRIVPMSETLKAYDLWAFRGVF